MLGAAIVIPLAIYAMPAGYAARIQSLSILSAGSKAQDESLGRRASYIVVGGQMIRMTFVESQAAPLADLRERIDGLGYGQVEPERFDGLLRLAVLDGQLEIMVRRFGIDRRNHRHETRQVELERGGVLHLRAHRKPEGFQSDRKSVV